MDRKEIAMAKQTPMSLDEAVANAAKYYECGYVQFPSDEVYNTLLTFMRISKELFEALTQLLSRLDYHGNIDLIREEGPIQDARDAITKSKGFQVERKIGNERIK